MNKLMFFITHDRDEFKLPGWNVMELELCGPPGIPQTLEAFQY